MAHEDQVGSQNTIDRKLQGISLQALVIFSTVVEVESFSQAAEKLGVSQPTISFQIGGLEAWCGVRLFHRKPKLALTDVGREFYLHTRLILNRVDELIQTLEHSHALKTGQVSIGYSGTRCALPLIGQFMARHPSIRVRTTTGNTRHLLQELNNCQIDIALLALDDPPQDVLARLVRKEDVCILVPVTHRLARKRTVKLAEVIANPIVTREPGSMTRALFEKACLLGGHRPRNILEVAGKDGMREAVAANIGIGISLASEVGDDQRLAGIKISDANVSGGTYIVYLKENADLPAVRSLVEIAAAI